MTSRVAIRFALAWLVAGVAVGAWTLGGVAGLPAAPPWLVAAHPFALLVGWFTQLVVGVAFWILPKMASGPRRGRIWPVLVSVAALNVAVITRVVECATDTPVTSSSALLVFAVAFFALHAAPRIKAFAT